MAGNVAAAFAYAADVSTEKDRPATMGFVGAAFGLGFIIGPALGGFLAGNTADAAGLARIAHVSAGMAALATLACVLFLKESHPIEARLESKQEHAVKQGFNLPKPALMRLYGGGLLMIAAFALMESIFGIWSKAVLNWTPRDLGIAFAVFGLISATLQGGAAGRLATVLGVGRMLRIGLCLYVFGFSVIIFANTAVGAYAGMTLLAIAAGLAGPSLQTLVSLQAAPHERGQVMGGLQGALSAGRAFGPLLAGPAFDAGGVTAPFVAAVALLLLTFLLVWPTTRPVQAET
jgi:DHA1 family tetracycline resistance protein-like MFS transporter